MTGRERHRAMVRRQPVDYLQPAPPYPYRNPALPVAARVADLLGRMTTAEKIGQLQNRLKGWECWRRAAGGVEPTPEFRAALANPGLGAVYGVFRADPFAGVGLHNALGFAEGARLVNVLQREAMAASRLGIPLLFVEEALHGLMAVGATTFPSPLTLAGAWDEELIERVGRAIAVETRAQGAHLVYAPVCDLALDPRWSRNDECFGEDPALAARLAAALVRGLQGDDLATPDQVGATLKHFAAHGASAGGFTSGPVSCGDNELRRLHLRPFHAAIQAGAVSAMACHVAVDGVPCHANHHLLTGILRHEWGFTGFVVADGNGIDLLGVDGFGFGHECVSGPVEAAAVALRAGVDSSLWDEAFARLDAALAAGLVTEADIDRACGRILRVKFQFGLFEQPLVDENRRAAMGDDPHRELAAEVAARSITLLQNRGDLLPLRAPPRRIAVIGPNADNPAAQIGDYTHPRPRNSVVTVLDGIRRRFAGSDVVYARGCGLRAGTEAELAATVAAARGADVVVLVLGGSSNRTEAEQNALGQSVAGTGDVDNGEGISKVDIRLWPCQRRLAAAIAATGAPTVAVLIQGRPHAIGDWAEVVPAILCAWQAGPDTGTAVAAIMAGDREPEGRLPVSMPAHAGALPVTHRRPLLGRQKYVDCPRPALFPLGYGLGYTTWALGEPVAEQVGRMIVVRVSVTNTGTRTGATVVQAYVHVPGALPVRPHRELAGWERVALPAGATQTATIRWAVAALALERERSAVAIHVGFDSGNTTGPCQLTVIQ